MNIFDYTFFFCERKYEYDPIIIIDPDITTLFVFGSIFLLALSLVSPSYVVLAEYIMINEMEIAYGWHS